MKVLALYDKSGPKYHRILLPAFHMGCELVINYKIVEEQIKDCDILFFNRGIRETTIQNVLDLREKYGFKIIVDFDDHWRLDYTHILYHHYELNRMSEVMETYIKEADCVLVTHSRLAEAVKPLNNNVEILPNAIPHWDQFAIEKTESDLTRLFWAGSVTHKNDIDLLKNPVKRFKGLPVKMVMGGYTDNFVYKIMASAFTNGGLMPHELLYATEVDKYYKMYENCDISLVPLVDNSFNRYKSNLKILEAANIGSPVIVSKVHPYLDLPFVNYVEKQSDWYSHVRMLLRDKEGAAYQAAKLKEYCDKVFNFWAINEKRKQIFEYVTGKQTTVREVPKELQSLD